MKFFLKALYLWKENDLNPRVLEFQPNKVNVITGGTGTGKSSIVHILNYCLMSSSPKIPSPHINDTIEWYGVNFQINNRNYFIARRRPDNFDKPCNDYYFSGIGEVPEYPLVTISDAELKLIMEREFGIEDNLVIPFGGREIKAGAKVSFRYFLLLNTQYEDTIADSHTFFDFKIHEENRYKEALDRIFDLIIGVGSVEKVVLQQKLVDLERQYTTIINKEKAKLKAQQRVDNNILELVSRAQKFNLLESKLFTPEEANDALTQLVQSVKTDINISPLKEFEELKQRKRRLLFQVRNLESLQRNATKYQETEINDHDSLKPIELIRTYYDDDIIKTFELKFLIDSLAENLETIKNNIESRKSFNVNIQKEIDDLKKVIVDIDESISAFPEDIEELRGEANKYIFIGELQTLLSLYNEVDNDQDRTQPLKKSELETQITALKTELLELENSRSIKNSLLSEFTNKSKDSVKEMLGAYSTYRAHFNTKDKVLNLIPPGSATPASNIGSRSNHMYMHLIMMFGLHEHMINDKNKYVPQFLILDQPSQPYYESSSGEKVDSLTLEDRKKLRNAFKMMNDFITTVNVDYQTDFQIILLEHAKEEHWIELNNFHLVDNFWDGRALVM